MRQVALGSGQVLILTPTGMAACPSEQGEILADAAAMSAEAIKTTLNMFAGLRCLLNTWKGVNWFQLAFHPNLYTGKDSVITKFQSAIKQVAKASQQVL